MKMVSVSFQLSNICARKIIKCGEDDRIYLLFNVNTRNIALNVLKTRQMSTHGMKHVLVLPNKRKFSFPFNNWMKTQFAPRTRCRKMGAYMFLHVLTFARSRVSCLNTRPLGRALKRLPRQMLRQ